jgi:AcrR family transcriptional regulator
MPRPPADRNALADAGGALLYESGIQASSVDELAAAAGVTKITLYRHFGSKDALLLQALGQRHARRQEKLERVLASAGDDWRSGILRVFDWLADWAGEPDFRGCAFVQARIEVGDRLPEVSHIALEHKREFARALLEHLERAGVEGAAEVVAQLQLLVEGATTLALLDGDAGHFRRARRAAAALLAGAGMGS